MTQPLNPNSDHDADETVDPRDLELTAFALGELDADAERAVRERLANDPAAQAQVDAISRIATLLEDDFDEADVPALTDLQRERIAQGSGAARPRPVILSSRVWLGASAIAAVLIAAFFLIPMLVAPDGGSSHVAIDDGARPPATDSREPARDTIDAAALSVRPEPIAKRAPDPSMRSLSGGDSVAMTDAIAPTAAPPVLRRPDPGASGRRPTPPPRKPPLPSAGAPMEAQRGLSPEQRRRARLRDVAPDHAGGGEAYAAIEESDFVVPLGDAAVSTLSIDVDTASFANVRRLLASGQLPNPDAVRIEELLNYFNYAYESPSGAHPYSVSTAIHDCPWAPEHRLMRVGFRAKEIDLSVRPATNLVFLLDVSGSMNRANKLPLVKQAIKLMVDHLTGDDRIAIVVYAGAAGLVLDSTWCDRKQEIMDTIDRLHAGGSTNGGAGIQLAYDVAEKAFIRGGVNRVILCTDGDFNVGVSGAGELEKLITAKRAGGVELSVLGFGTGNVKDDRMQALAEKGNGNASYIDSIDEARKVLVDEMGGTLVTVAKNVKLQVAFNPEHVASYRQIGYASRRLAAEEFRDDTVDAGELGAGHTVTFLYEIVPGRAPDDDDRDVDLIFQEQSTTRVDGAPEMAMVMTRYQEPGAEEGAAATEFRVPVIDAGATLDEADADFQFAAAITAFGMLLRDSPYAGNATWELVNDLASPGAADAGEGSYRAAFLAMLDQARTLKPITPAAPTDGVTPRPAPGAGGATATGDGRRRPPATPVAPGSGGDTERIPR